MTSLRTLALTAALGLAAALVPAQPAHACTAQSSPSNPPGYCENPGGFPYEGETVESVPECHLRLHTYEPGYPAWGMDSGGGAASGRFNVAVYGNAGATITLTGYERPSTDVKHLGSAVVGNNNRRGHGMVYIPVTFNGNARVFATTDAEQCSEDPTRTAVAPVQARLGAVAAYRSAPRQYAFSGFYAGPDGKVLNLYRVADGRSILTAQTRAYGERWSIRRTFLGSGAWDFFARVGTDINSLGTQSPSRFTVIH